MSVKDLATVLGDTSLTWTERRTRLQGWRGHDAECADAAVGAQRLGPAVCAAGALAGAVLQSPILLLAFAITAMLCVPSMIFTALWGVERACAPSLIAAARAGERVHAGRAEPR
jgi:hypothetical protein